MYEREVDKFWNWNEYKKTTRAKDQIHTIQKTAEKNMMITIANSFHCKLEKHNRRSIKWEEKMARHDSLSVGS